MHTSRNIFILLIIIIIALGALVGLYWANSSFINYNPSGGADFIVGWKSMRNFMLDNVNPYGDVTLQNIQSLVYKKSALKSQYPYHVNIPLFLLIFFIPLAWISDLVLARIVWLIILETALIGVVWVSLRLTNWRPHWLLLSVILLFSVFWFPTFSMLTTGTAIILQAFLFYAALRSINLGADELAGALMALCLLNIEATGMVFLGLIVWVVSTQRWRIAGGLVMTLVVIIGLSVVFYPTWVLSFIGSTLANWRSGTMPSTYAIFEAWMPGIGKNIARIISIVALTIILFEWSAMRGQEARWLTWTISLTAAITPLLGFPYFPQWTVFTLPGILLVISVMVQRWKLPGLISALLVLAGVFIGLWGAQFASNVSAFVMLYPFLLTLLLYWVRWGAVRQPRLWADEILLRG